MSGASVLTRAGISAKEFKLFTVEAGEWLWGTVKGAYNEKQTLSQIIVDAVIGMIPVVGDITAVRDLTAVGSGLATDPVKREHKMEWVLLVVLIFALIPVFGGVVKGVGRVAIRATEDIVKDSVAVAKMADEIITFLNRIGHKNAEAWFKALNVMKYEGEIINKFRAFCDTFILAIDRYALRFKQALPQSLVARMEQLSNGFKQIKELGDKMIPDALKELHNRLQRLQQYIHAGGVPKPNRSNVMLAQTGQKTVTYAEEARLVESGSAKSVVYAGKFPQNLAATDAQVAKVYKYEKGFPKLKARKETVRGIEYYSAIAAASGPIKNEMLSGETLFRAFGPEGKTHGYPINESFPVGFWWGRGAPPKTAKEWREKCAVLDEWNRNGWLSILHIPPSTKMPACTSTVSEQFSKEIAGQYLEGGAKQAALDLREEKMIQDATDRLYKRGGGKETVHLLDGQKIIVEVKQSDWSGINGKVGYGEAVIPGAAVMERLGVTEQQTKVARQATQGEAKQQRSQ